MLIKYLTSHSMKKEAGSISEEYTAHTSVEGVYCTRRVPHQRLLVCDTAVHAWHGYGHPLTGFCHSKLLCDQAGHERTLLKWNAAPGMAASHLLPSAPYPGVGFGPRSPLANKTTMDGHEKAIKNTTYMLVSWCEMLERSILLQVHPA